jgi:hypothetical protein
MQTRSNYKIVCDHYCGSDKYYALKVNPKRRHWRGEPEDRVFIGSVEFSNSLYDDAKHWVVNMPEFESRRFISKEEAETFVKALIALNY